MHKLNTSLYPSYSHTIATLALIFSFYSIFALFISSSFVWVIIGISYTSSFICYIKGANFVHSFLTTHINSKILVNSILSVNAIILFISSVVGLIDFLYLLKFSSRTSLYIPISIFVILLFASCLGLHQPVKSK